MPDQKMITLPDFLTDKQIQHCIDLYPDRQRIRDEVIVPNMAEINRRLGQENDPDFLSYAIIYVIGESSRRSLS